MLRQRNDKNSIFYYQLQLVHMCLNYTFYFQVNTSYHKYLTFFGPSVKLPSCALFKHRQGVHNCLPFQMSEATVRKSLRKDCRKLVNIYRAIWKGQPWYFVRRKKRICISLVYVMYFLLSDSLLVCL